MSATPYHHGDLRGAAVRAAGQIVGERGAGALTTRAVAAAVGVSHGALYRHFADRAGLLDAVAAAWLDEVVADASAAADLEGFVARYASLAVANEHLYRCVFDAAAQPDAELTRTALVALRRRAAEVFATATGAEGDEVRDGVMEMWGTLHGMLDLYWRKLLRARTPRAAAEHVTATVVARWVPGASR